MIVPSPISHNPFVPGADFASVYVVKLSNWVICSRTESQLCRKLAIRKKGEPKAPLHQQRKNILQNSE